MAASRQPPSGCYSLPLELFVRLATSPSCGRSAGTIKETGKGPARPALGDLGIDALVCVTAHLQDLDRRIFRCACHSTKAAVARLQAPAPVHPSTEIDWCYQAARAGHLEVLQWLCTEGRCRLRSSVSQIAAALGHLHVIEWVVDNTVGRPAADMPLRARANPGMFVWCQAVSGGQVHVLQWAFAKGWIC
jgi:hypothetical protein